MKICYSNLSPEEKVLFQKAKQKELHCWLDTNTVKAIMRDKIHPSRIMASRWILTWKEDPNAPNGKKAKARLVVKGFQDPDIGSLMFRFSYLDKRCSNVASSNRFQQKLGDPIV